MDRRKFIKAAALGGAGTALAAPMVHAQAAKTITIVSTWPRDFPGLGLSAQRLAERINVVSGGALRTEYFAAGERVGAFDVFDEVASGNSQAYIAAEYYWGGKGTRKNNRIGSNGRRLRQYDSDRYGFLWQPWGLPMVA